MNILPTLRRICTLAQINFFLLCSFSSPFHSLPRMITQVPVEIFHEICGFLPTCAIVNLAITCTHSFHLILDASTRVSNTRGFRVLSELMKIVICKAQTTLIKAVDKYGRSLKTSWFYWYHDTRFVFTAVDNNHFGVVKLLYSLGHTSSEITCEHTASKGYLHMIKFFESVHQSYVLQEEVMDAAIRNGHIHIVKYLHKLGCKPRYNGIILAAINGHLKIVKFLHNLGDGFVFVCNDRISTTVAKNGHLHVLQWMYHNGYNFSKDIFIFTAAEGQLEIVQWLLSVSSVSDSLLNTTINYTKVAAHAPVFEYLVDVRKNRLH